MNDGLHLSRYLTGDLASIDHTGRLRLIDRVSAVVSTSGGDVVSPGHLESILEDSSALDYALIHAAPKFKTLVLLLHLHPQDSKDTSSTMQGPSNRAGRGQVNGSGESWDLEVVSVAEAQRIVGVGVWHKFLEALTDSLGYGAERLVVPALAAAGTEWTVKNGMLSGELKKRRKALNTAYGAALNRTHETQEESKVPGWLPLWWHGSGSAHLPAGAAGAVLTLGVAVAVTWALVSATRRRAKASSGLLS